MYRYVNVTFYACSVMGYWELGNKQETTNACVIYRSPCGSEATEQYVSVGTAVQLAIEFLAYF